MVRQVTGILWVKRLEAQCLLTQVLHIHEIALSDLIVESLVGSNCEDD